MHSLCLRGYRRVVVLTGAGVSAPSGLPTYRGEKGLWKDKDKRDLATAQAIADDPDSVWAMFSRFRAAVREASPNPAHRAIFEMEGQVADGGTVVVITQNVDGLHQRAGSSNVIELHGSLLRTRCSTPDCRLEPFDDKAPPSYVAPRCPRCEQALRPDVVLFGELIGGQEHLAKRALRECDLFLAVGTSGTVSPASSFVRSAEYAGARTICINLEAMNPPHPAIREEIVGRAEVLLPALIGAPGR